jgi:hypothetical protein
MDKKTWMTGMARAPRGSTRLQIPMHCYRYSEWKAVIQESISRGINKSIAAQTSLRRLDRLEKKKIREGQLVRFSSTDGLLIHALSIHVCFYRQIANEEAGFDLGIKPLQIVIGEPDGYAVPFGTIRSEACDRLLAFEDVKPLYRGLLRIRRERLKSSGFSGQIDKSESLMDLLVAALPYTTRNIGMSTPREIIDRAVEDMLQPFNA